MIVWDLQGEVGSALERDDWICELKLYSGLESGNSWKLRILLDQLAVPFERVDVDLLKWEHKSARFMSEFNPRGQVPVLEDDGKRFWDSGAGLVYIARKYERLDWLPVDAAGMAEVMQWVTLAASEIQFGLQYTRRGVMRDRWIAGNLEQLQAIGKLALKTLEWRLAGHDWLALDHITIADIACFPYVYHAPEAKLSLDPYPSIGQWLDRCQALPNWAKAPHPPTRDYPDMPVAEG
jgi:glutathione S-transferase